MMRVPFMIVVLAATGCAGKDGSWPSLARRPIEGPRPGATAVAANTPVPAEPAPAVTQNPAAPPPAIGDVSAEVATIDRDAANLGNRIAEQRATATAAARAAKGSKPDGDAWGTAQLELTRLERLGSQLVDLRGRLDGVAGRLAAAAGGGADVTGPLKATGATIGRVDALVADYDAAFAAASAAATPN